MMHFFCGDRLGAAFHFDQAASENPIFILTAHTALGLWTEGSGEKNQAIAHYREAHSSHMDELPEYKFALERIRLLRHHDDRQPSLHGRRLTKPLFMDAFRSHRVSPAPSG